MARKWLTMLTLAGCAWMLTATAALAQTTISADTSAQFIDFYTGQPSGSLDVVLGWEPGNNYTGTHTLTGGLASTSAAGAWGMGPTFTLTSNDPIALAADGSGGFAAQASALASSAFSVMSGGATVFQGVLSSLNFNQTAGSPAVSLQAGLNGTGSYASNTYTLLGTIMLAPGANINDVANLTSPVDEAGVIVPEPGTVMLFGTGLLFLVGLGVMRRRETMI